jgi:N-acetylglucosamine-6-phosphate deacetylase
VALAGLVLTSEGLRPGRLYFSERIEAFEPAPVEGPYILPGFIDLHVHGGAGWDTMAGEEGVRGMARFHLAHGTTALLPTTVTAPPEEILGALEGIRRAMEAGRGEARILGAHLEGPFISPRRLGAQPPFPREPDLELMAAFLEAAPVRVVTLAPELPGALDLIRFLSSRGVRPQVGHTEASYREALLALEAGATGFTHLYNAMPPLHHRHPGPVGLALERGGHAEAIPDGLHVDPAALRLALKCIPGLYFVSNAVAAAGMPDGPYALGRHRVEKRGEGVWLGESLAGSTLTLDQALRNLVAFGLSLEEAARRLSTVPARYLGLRDLGEIAPGKLADLVVLDERLRVLEVYLGGERVFGAAQTG